MQEKIIEMLKNAGGFLSGEEISRRLGVSRSAVWKAVTALRGKGYVIESVTNRGYRLGSVPDLLGEAQISEGLKTAVLGRTVSALAVVDSTNNEAKRQAVNGAPHGMLFVAEDQTGGKGRLGRPWSTKPGEGVWMSLLLRPELTPFEVPAITLIAGLAVCRAIRALTPCDAKIKWPNDVIIGNRKVCGILTEMSAEAERVDFVVVGIGVNVAIAEFPEELKEKATSLFLETGTLLARAALTRQILFEFEELYDDFVSNACSDLASPYKELCATLGRRVSLTRGGKVLEGVAADIQQSGDLVVDLDEGGRIAVNSGEVTVQGIY